MPGSKKIVIAFDAECLVTPNPSGVAYYTRGLIMSIAGHLGDRVELVGHYCNLLGRKNIKNLPAAPNISYVVTKTVSVRMLNMLRRLGVPVPFELLLKQRADFHLFTAFIGWPSLFKTPSAPMIHDTTFLDHPEYVNTVVRYDLKKLVPKEVKRASFIITNSKTSAEHLRKHLDIGKKTIVVGYIPPVNTADVSTDEAKKILADLGITGNYILSLGNLEPRKNLTALIEAYGQLDKDVQNQYALVLAGSKGWLDEEITQAIAQAKSKGLQVITPGHVDDRQRAALYTRATIFTLVSFYEGFGMPLLEAMRYKTTILASDIPVSREIAGEAARFCGTSSPDIAKALVRLLQDQALRRKLVAAGEKRLRDFSWRTVSELIMSEVRKATK